MDTPARSLAATFYNNALLSDVVVDQTSSDGQVRQYHAHKFVLCVESQFFYKAFTGNFKEASDNVINLQEDDPDHFEFLLKFIYTKQYDAEALRNLAANHDNNVFAVLLDIHVIADKYVVTALRDHALKDIRDILTRGKYGQHIQACLSYAIEAYYGAATGLSSDLGDFLVAILLGEQQDFTDSDAFDTLIQSYPQLAVDLTMSQKQAGWFNTYRVICPQSDCRFVQLLQANQPQKECLTSAYCQRCGIYYRFSDALRNN